MRLFNLALLIALCSCFYGCKQKHSKKVALSSFKQLSMDLTSTDLKSSEAVFTDFRFVKLETTTKSLLSGVLRAVFADDKLFILSAFGQDVMVFDNFGKYLFKLEKGRGPQEILYPTDIAIDETKKRLLVVDYYKNVKIFNFKGEYIESIALNSPQLYLATIGDNFLLFDSNFDKKTDYYAHVMIDNKMFDSFLPKDISELRKKDNMIYPYPFSKSGQDTVFVASLFSDTIYAVYDNGYEWTSFYVLDYKGREMNQSEHIKSISGFGEYLDYCENNNLGSGVRNFVKFEDCLFYSINAGEQYFCVYDLNDNAVKFYSNLIRGLPNLYSMVGNSKNCIIYAMTASRLYNYFEKNPVSENDSESIKQLRRAVVSDEDNPFIFMCELHHNNI